MKQTTYKQYAATVEPISDRKMGFVISTASVDRDGDTVDPKGWDLNSYTKNPVVLWSHDYSQPPIGKAVSIRSTDTGLHAEVEFLPKGMSPFADMIHDMVKGGFLNATSVGFRGVEYDPSKERKSGYDFKKQELLEFSIVPVPSNPEALAQRGVTNGQVQRYAKAMRHWTKSVLGDDAPKLDAEQFDNLADAIAKAMKTPEEPKPTEAALDYAAIAAEVAKLLLPEIEKRLPAPDAGEAEDEFISRCMGSEAMQREFPDQKQRLAVCYSQQRRSAAPDATKGDISKDVLDLTPPVSEIDWDAIKFDDAPQFDSEAVSKLLRDGMRETIREMVGASAQAAINKMTGRLD